MTIGIRHIGLVVADLDTSLAFWVDVMGFSLIVKMDESGAHIDAMIGLEGVRLTTAKLAAPKGGILELLKFHSHPDVSEWKGKPFSTGLTHIALTVEDLDGLSTRLLDAGVTSPGPAQLSPDGSVKVIYVTGLEGLLLELVEIL